MLSCFPAGTIGLKSEPAATDRTKKVSEMFHKNQELLAPSIRQSSLSFAVALCRG